MNITINQIENGIALLMDNQLWLVSEYQHVKPGKGSAFVRVKLRNVKTDNVLERTFRTSEVLEEVPLEQRELEFLYQSGNDFNFMDHDTYEETMIPGSEIGEAAHFLLENMEVTGLSYNNKIVKVILPNFIVTEITETEPGIRGDSSRAGNKPAKIATGATILVPLFINAGDNIKIDTRSGTYVERIQK